jgi:hypothetical protein
MAERLALEPNEAAIALHSGLAVLRSAVVSTSGSLMATYGESSRGDYRLTVWELPSGAEKTTTRLAHQPVAVCFTPDETAIVAALRDSEKVVIERRPLPELTRADEVIYEKAASGIAMSRDSRTAVLRNTGAGLTVVDTVTSQAGELGWESHFDKITVSPRGERAAAANGTRIEVYDLISGSRPFITRNQLVDVVEFGSVSTMDCTAGFVVAASGNSASLVRSGGQRVIYSAPEPIRRIALGTGGSVLAVAYGDRITIVDLGTGKVLADWTTPGDPIGRLTFRLDDKVLVTAHQSNVTRLWDLPVLPGSDDHVDWQSDAPASVDLLQRVPLARALAARLRQFQRELAHDSFLVHIDGPWGSGKTTLLGLLQQELERTPPDNATSATRSERAPSPKKRQWVAIRFNAWQQSKIGVPWWSLLAALRRDLTRDRSLLARWWLRVAEAWGRFRRASAPFALACIVLAAIAAGFFLLLRPSKVTFASSSGIAQGVTAVVIALGTLWAGARVAARFLLWDSAQGARLYEQSSTNPRSAVGDHFGWLIAKAGKPVIFFIDDLDRCPDSYVVDLLETVQTLIRAPGGDGSGSANPPLFVVAADGAWIRRSFEASYSQFASSVGEPGLPLGYLFLDKLFQLHVPVPRIDAVWREHYLKNLLGGRVPQSQTASAAPSKSDVSEKIARSRTQAEVQQAYTEAPREVRAEISGEAVEKLSTLAVATDTEHWLQQFAALLPPNPRAMKRFINDYTILSAVRILEGNTVAMAPLALWAIIETRWPGMADYLRENPNAISLAVPAEAGDGAREASSGGRQIPDSVPADLRGLLADPEFRKVATFRLGGPLTPELIAQCCGTTSGSAQS